MSRNHRLSQAELAQLATGTGDPGVIRALRAAQLSKRMLQLRILRDTVRCHRFDDHYDLLARAGRSAPEVGRRMLALPHTGAWLAATLRRLRGTRPEEVPIDVDLGYLGALAAVAASSAGLDFTVDVPPRAGTLFLPDLGRAVVGGAAPVTVSRAGGQLRVGPVVVPEPTGADGAGWQGLRRLRSRAGRLAVTLRLDDLDPFRDCHDLSAAGRLAADSVAAWQRMLDAAWSNLVDHHRDYAEAIAEGLTTVVPLLTRRTSVGMNVTSMESFGAVALTTPVDGHALALGLLHEFQHAKLGAVLDLVPLYQRDDRPRFYAPWRDDPRPLGAALQGVYAFLGVTDYWRVERRVRRGSQARLAEVEFVRWRDRVWRTFCELASAGQFTPVGERFLALLRARQEAWQAEPASAPAVEQAREAAEDHWIGWRLRNRQPDPAAVARLADAWHQGLPCPTGPVVTTTTREDQGRLLAHSHRLDLARLRIADPDRFAQLRAEPDTLATVLPGASAADLALAGGDHRAAQQAYRSQIIDGDDRLAPWVGLALAGHRQGNPALLALPELCLAVHRHVRATRGQVADPLVLAHWLLPATGPDGAARPAG
jgi:HEXXH motif-containing protein